MKSEDALDYLHGTIDEKEFLNMTDLLPFHDAITAIEIAEADRDAKAIEAHRVCCPNYAETEEQMSRCQLATECIECKYMKSFIEKLNK